MLLVLGGPPALALEGTECIMGTRRNSRKQPHMPWDRVIPKVLGWVSRVVPWECAGPLCGEAGAWACDRQGSAAQGPSLALVRRGNALARASYVRRLTRSRACALPPRGQD